MCRAAIDAMRTKCRGQVPELPEKTGDVGKCLIKISGQQFCAASAGSIPTA
jgi:hypothetical protein